MGKQQSQQRSTLVDLHELQIAEAHCNQTQALHFKVYTAGQMTCRAETTSLVAGSTGAALPNNIRESTKQTARNKN